MHSLMHFDFCLPQIKGIFNCLRLMTAATIVSLKNIVIESIYPQGKQKSKYIGQSIPSSKLRLCLSFWLLFLKRVP